MRWIHDERGSMVYLCKLNYKNYLENEIFILLVELSEVVWWCLMFLSLLCKSHVGKAMRWHNNIFRCSFKFRCFVSKWMRFRHKLIIQSDLIDIYSMVVISINRSWGVYISVLVYCICSGKKANARGFILWVWIHSYFGFISPWRLDVEVTRRRVFWRILRQPCYSHGRWIASQRSRWRS